MMEYISQLQDKSLFEMNKEELNVLVELRAFSKQQRVELNDFCSKNSEKEIPFIEKQTQSPQEKETLVFVKDPTDIIRERIAKHWNS